jgi:hypothetical protein
MKGFSHTVLVQLLDRPTLSNWHDLHTLQGRHLAQPRGVLDARGLVGEPGRMRAGLTRSSAMGAQVLLDAMLLYDSKRVA